MAQDRLQTHLANGATTLTDLKAEGKDVSALAKELDDNFEGPKSALEQTFKEQERTLEAQEKELKRRILEAKRAGETAQLEAKRQERARAKAWADYQEELEYARRQVEQGYWRQGKFTRGTHPKTGEEQWELTLKSKGVVIKYVVDRWSRQPTTENEEYFYSKGRTLVNTAGFHLILVRLENPLPEDKPEEPESSPDSTLSETSSQTLQDALVALKKKWRAK